MNILLVDSHKAENTSLGEVLSELKSKGYEFFLLSSRKRDEAGFWKKKGLMMFGPSIEADAFFRFLIALPVLLGVNFFRLSYYKLAKQVKTIVLVGWNEKLIFTPLARILRIKPVWIELPGNDYRKLNRLARFAFRRKARYATVIVLGSLAKHDLVSMGLPAENISILQPGIKLNQREHQDTLFSELAENKGSKFKKKFFTVGTVTDLNTRQNIEMLFQTVKICAEVIPNIQLIVVGEGKVRKDLTWTAKKMGIETLVWLVGQHGHMRKWLDSCDIYVVSSQTLHWTDLDVALKCMGAGLPVVGPQGKGLEDIVYDGKTGCLLETFDSEMLAREIIRLYQDRRLCRTLGQLAQDRVKKFFTLTELVDQFQKLII